jgi:polar amino acid transport system substrate-binding protein
MTHPRTIVGVGAVALALTASACGSSDDNGSSSSSSSGGGTSATAKVTPPPSIKKSGKLVFCSDISYPPEEFYNGTTPDGSDIEIGKAVGQQLGVGTRFDNTGFDGIIPALQGKKCDAIISGMNDTPERAKQVDFVDYLNVGQSFMVQKGNPPGIHSMADVAGKTVSVEVGTTNADFLKQESKKLEAQGKKPITVQTFPKDTDAANALHTNKVDAYFGDAPVVAYYITKAPDAFEFGGKAVNPVKVGIAIRKGDPLKTAVAKAVHNLYADGTIDKILAKWKLSDSALKS